MQDLRVAIVHDWLVTYAGAERVLEQMIDCFPQADLMSVVDFLPSGERDFLRGKRAKTTFIQRMPGSRKHYRSYLSLMPIAIEQLDLSAYEIVISSSHAVAKGVLTGPDQLHVCMCYSPVRYAWDLQHQYLDESGLKKGLKGALARYLLHRLRLWDTRTSNGVDEFISISQFISRRIDKAYRRPSTVIYPPVDVDQFTMATTKSNFYVTASRMVPYKKIPLIVEAFSAMPHRQLVVIGDGPDLEKVKAKASPNVKLLGRQPFAVLREHLQQAQAFVFAAEEDFGIAPLEAQACGTPVIAYGKGGAAETIRGLETDDGATGVLFHEQSVAAICNALDEFELNTSRISPMACRKNAERFSPSRFRSEFSTFMADAAERFMKRDHT